MNTTQKDLIGKVYFREIVLKIEILKVDKEVPSEHLEDFIEWLKCKAVEVGTGKQYEHYGYTDDYKDDIGVSFYVTP